MTSAAFRLPQYWPHPHDATAAARLVERFAELGRVEARLVARPAVAAMLGALGGNSPFLADLAIREAASVRTLVAEGPDVVAARAFAAIAALPVAARRDRVAATLRQAKRVIALVTAIADIGELWPLERVTGTLSELAEAALRRAVAHLLRAAHDTGELRLPDPAEPERGGGLVVLGMGKLGARELNYSSDIDLILLNDPSADIYTARSAGDAMGGFTTRLARALVALMETRDADGYVFRTDLRLRPDPSVTPPVVSLPAAIAYYESMGQNWERAAMIKARPVAGDLALGAGFLEAIRPFVWRRGLDFAAVADIAAMKRRIDEHKGGALADARDPVARIAGHNVKLGEGGIREIEFLAQTLQLVWGGRDPVLRAPTTLGALGLLVRAGHLSRRGEKELAAAYRFLRVVEHRLQMVADRQTHELPTRPEELERFAVFMGYADAHAFASALLAQLERVRARYAQVFEHVPELAEAASGVALDFRGVDAVPEATRQALVGLGYGDTARITEAVRGWQAGRVRALRSERARDLMARMLPAVLAALGRQPQPDAAFGRFDGFLARLPAGVQILSLFERNPGLLDRIAAVLGAAPSLAEYLASTPAALDGLLSPEEAPEAVRLLRTRLADARLLEEVIGIIRRTVREEEFGIAVATLEGRVDADQSGLRRAELADAALDALLGPVLRDFADRFGRVRGGAMAAVALGKAGGQEMMAGSDLDLMLVYDHPEEVTESRGARSLPASQWFVRAAHAYVAAVTAPGVDGQLYAVDMRLRPSGNKGPVAVSLGGFRSYHASDAWTWERMALTRARVVAGPAVLRKRVEAAVAEAIVAAGEPARIGADAASMRARMLRDLPPHGPWDVKLRAGGQVEVEFIAQVLQLIHARDDRGVCSATTRVALEQLRDAGHLPAADAALLIRADRVWRTVQGMLRITIGRAAPAELPEATARPLLRAAEVAGVAAVDLPVLRASLDALAGEVRAAFVRHIGEIKG
ncbi:MAG TPA: bifunctional [glutamine synthetase] adenylyltransferase/[glutamine synthetase]-adenylyl-L-tyrosine phosphorylase [Acetobacteraceae bacterium]|jgi:glutamate-ammonia-ligase adenylyltransferase|nr:bifunctional [glutamine synthetase] adenylyltransferase/[glutamine synthetase]-adenylyl-L-tyrosine phosphorylase [Acetobacteraceae bacterium]